MIVKITKGTSWRGAHDYISGKPNAQPVCTNLTGHDARSAAREIGAFRKLRPSLNKAIAHFSLSLPPDEARLSTQQWEKISLEFLQQMGFEGCPYTVYRHTDTDHDHVHILVLRISDKGSTISDRHDYRRAEAVARELEQRHQLKPVFQKQVDASKTQTRRPVMQTNTNHNTASAAQTFTAESGYGANPKALRERRRYIFSDDYPQQVELILQPYLPTWKKFNDAIVWYLQPQGTVRDKGDWIQCKDIAPANAAELIVKMAIARGWNTIRFSGTDQFLFEAMRRAIQSGLVVSVVDAHQQMIFDQVRQSMGLIHLGLTSGKASGIGPATDTETELPSLMQTVGRLGKLPKPAIDPQRTTQKINPQPKFK